MAFNFGLTEVQQSMLETIDAKIAAYPSDLRDRLEEMGAEIVPPPPEIDLMEVAQRAIDGRAPYSNKTKDSFRDTLIWHTVRSIAAEDSDCEVWIVSENDSDFGEHGIDSAECPYPLHPDLIDEVEADQASGRIKYVRTLGRLKQHLDARYDPLPDDERDALLDRVNKTELENVLRDEVVSMRLQPAAAALPLATFRASIRELVIDTDHLELVDAALRGASAWTAQFNITVDATIDIAETTGDTTSIQKKLRVDGRMEINADGDVVWLGVASIEALPEDPMRRGWEQFQSRWPNEVVNLDQYRVLPMAEIAAEAQRKIAEGLRIPPMAEIAAEAQRKIAEGLRTPPMAEIAAEAQRKIAEGLRTPPMAEIAAEAQRKIIDSIASNVTATEVVADIQKKVADALTVKILTDAISERGQAREAPPPDAPDVDGGATDDGYGSPEVTT